MIQSHQLWCRKTMLNIRERNRNSSNWFYKENVLIRYTHNVNHKFGHFSFARTSYILPALKMTTDICAVTLNDKTIFKASLVRLVSDVLIRIRKETNVIFPLVWFSCRNTDYVNAFQMLDASILSAHRK